MLKYNLSRSASHWARVQQIAEYFGQTAFTWLVVLMVVPEWIWLGYHLQTRQIDVDSGLLLILMLIGAVVLVYWLAGDHYLMARFVFLAVQLVFISSMLWLLRDLTVGYLYLLPIVVAGSLLGSIGAVATAGIVMAVELVVTGLSPELGSAPDLVGRLLVPQLITAVAASQAATGLFEALDSAETWAMLAGKHADEAREHRAELQRKIKSLDLAHAQLERVSAELYHAREVANAAFRFKSEFAAQISHELRTSLNLIVGFSETIAFAQQSYGARLPTAYLRDVTEIYRNSRHVLALIDDVLDLSRLEAGRMGLNREWVDLGPALGEALDIVRPLAETKGVALRLELPKTLPPLRLDRIRIRQVLINLLSNAARVTAHGHIVVKAILRRDELVVQVEDTGPGIPPENLKHVFEEFHQVDVGPGSKGSAGLGLAVSKQIVELHGGWIWVESTAGQGSTFSFALPFEKNAALPLPGSAPILQVRPPQPAVVLLEGEDPAAARFLQRHLEGFSVEVAATPNEASRLVVQTSARVVIVDSAWASTAAAETLAVPVVACPLPGLLETEKTIGVAGYLCKPITAQMVQNALRQAAPHARDLLIVDDDPSAIRLIERMLHSAVSPYRVFRAYSAAEALARLRAQPTDAILLDLVMPEGDGFTLLSALHEDSGLAEIPVVVVSGYTMEETRQSGPIGITSQEGFTPTEILRYLQALLSAVPPAPVERYTTVPPLPVDHPV